MDFYDEEYESNYKPSYKYEDKGATFLIDLALVALALTLVIEAVYYGA